MREEERKSVNKVQLNRFFSSYYTEWRHIKILSISKILKNKYEFYSDILEEIKITDNNVGEYTICQEINNGLLFDAIQQSVQYIEDLFALINACENPNYFIRNIIKYNAGKIENKIKQFDFEKRNICKSFFFPYYEMDNSLTDKEKEVLEVMYKGIDRLGTILKEITEYYKKYHFFYTQYKHGLSIALRPYANYTNEHVKMDKEGKFEQPPIVALDSLNFKNASKNQYGNAGVLMIPHFTDIIRLKIKELQNENNLLRFVLSPPGTSIDTIVKIAKKTKRCMQILVHNFLETINDKELMNLRMPSDDNNEVFEFQIKVEDLKE